MIRLFTALEIPADITGALAAMQRGLPGASWVAPENFHITVRYVGEVNEAMATDVDETLSDLRMKPQKIIVNGLGSFGDKKAPRSIWAGVDLTDGLTALHQKVERTFRDIGLPPDRRKFKPHVTMARLRGPSNSEAARWIEEQGLVTFPSFTATRLVLFSSQRRAEGAIYTPERYYIF